MLNEIGYYNQLAYLAFAITVQLKDNKVVLHQNK